MRKGLLTVLVSTTLLSLAGCQKAEPVADKTGGAQPGTEAVEETGRTDAPDMSAAADRGEAAEDSAKGQADWRPDGQVELVVPFGAGGSSDLSARALVPYLQEELGCSIYVNNLSGAGGLTGTSYALNKKADGYTLIWQGTRSVSPEVYQSNPPYTTADLKPIAELCETYSVVAVSKNSPFETMEDFVEYAKANQGLKYAHTGRGYKNHLTALVLDSTYGLGMTEVPYGGDADACTAVLRGDVDAGFISLTTAFTQYEAGKMKILAVCNGTRNEKIPDIPTLGETEYPIDDIVSYIGLFCSKDTPDEVVESLSRAVEKCTEDPGLKENIEGLGMNLAYRDHREFGELVNSINEVVAPIWKNAGLLE